MTDKKQTAEDTMERTFRRIGESEEEITRTKDLMFLARIEEREKVLAEQGDYFDLRENPRIKDAEAKGRREILSDLLQHGSWLRVKELAKKYGVKL